jgi:hypothetical protein
MRLGQREPVLGDALVLEGTDWKVTGAVIYRTDEGHRVHEWKCEHWGSTAYLLREEEKPGDVRWFFTREIPSDPVKLGEGQTLAEWMKTAPAPTPPPALANGITTYRYEDTTEGTHEDAPGGSARKTTWDYWDQAHTANLAVEVWDDGSFDCYLGAYVRPAQVAVRPGGAASAGGHGLWKHPVPAALVFVPCAYFLPFIGDRPFDECMAFALPVAFLGGWVLALANATFAAGLALLAAPVLGAVFWQFPPLTSGIGIAVILGVPFVLARAARRRKAPGPRSMVLYAACYAVATPLLLLGLYSYFVFAPAPHTFDQFALALAPSAFGALAARVMGGIALRGGEEGGK